MITLIVLIGVFLLLIVGSLLLAMLVFNQAKSTLTSTPEKPLLPVKFKIRYIALSLVVLPVTLIMVLWLAPKVPLTVGYNLDDNSNPLSFMTRRNLIVLTVLPQLLLTFLAFIVSWGVTKLGNVFRTVQEGGLPLNSLLLVMGNIIGLPQLIIFYAMTNIFTYNAYQVTLPPLWIFTLAVMAVAGIVLAIFFINMMRKMGGITLKDK